MHAKPQAKGASALSCSSNGQQKLLNGLTDSAQFPAPYESFDLGHITKPGPWVPLPQRQGHKECHSISEMIKVPSAHLLSLQVSVEGETSLPRVVF